MIQCHKCNDSFERKLSRKSYDIKGILIRKVNIDICRDHSKREVWIKVSKLNFINDCANYAKIIIGGIQTNLCCDTGASVITKRLVDKLPSNCYALMINDRFSIAGISGICRSIRNKINLKFKIGGQDFDHTFYV